MSPARVFVGVGSNVEPLAHIPRAVESLAREAAIAAVSTFYRTPALNRPEQPPFVNGVLELNTDISPRALKSGVLRRLEEAAGRRRTADRHAPRTLDLDLLLHGALVSTEPDLRLPDPDIRTRAFVGAPLLELAPALVLPDTGERLADLPSAHPTPDMEALDALTARLRGLAAAPPAARAPLTAPPERPRRSR